MITPPQVKRRERQSSLELLRIVAILLVLLIHYIPFRGELTPVAARSDVFNTLGTLSLKSLCIGCVNLFVLISGYFGIRPKRRSILRLVSDIAIWVAIALAITYIMGDFANGLSYIADSYMGAFSHWFVVSYLGLCLLSPILNAWLEKTDDGALLKYIAIFYIFSTLFGYLFYAKFHRPVDFNEGMSILSFVGLYLVGALIRRNSFSWLRKGKMLYLAVFARCGVLLVAVAYTALLFGLTVSPYGYINPLVVIESAALFIFFTKLHMGEIRWINIIAGSAFAVFIFHYVSPCNQYYNQICGYIQENFNPALPVALLFLVAIYIFVAAVDFFRHKFVSLCRSFISAVRPSRN